MVFEYTGNYSNTSISVAGPNGYYLSSVLKKGAPMLDLLEGGYLDDGLYKYQIRVATDQKVVVRESKLNNGRGNKERKTRFVGATQSSTFLIKGGSIIDKSELTVVEGEGKK